MFKTNSQSQKHYSTNKQHLSANGFSLLPLALRPCLFLTITIVFAVTLLGFIFCDDTAFATASTLTLSVDSDSLLLELKPTSPNGTFASSTGHINIGANTNNAAGYTLKLAAKTADDRTLSDTDGNGLNPLAAATTLADFSDDTESGTAYNNKWGYLPSRRCTTSNDSSTCADNTTNYFPAPTTTGDILDITTVANASSAASDNTNYTVAIGARATTSTKATTYEGTFVITVVANPTPYIINYDPNTQDTVTNMPTTSSGNATAETVSNAVNNIVPVRTGYKFLGWCSTTTENSNNTDTCGGTIYNPNGGGTNRNYTVDQTSSNNTITLYAMWQKLYNIQFIAGSNIDTIIVADGNNNYKPQYAINGTNNGITALAVPENTKLLVTVVPESNYILDSWTSSNTTTERLASNTLLTTTYTVGALDETLTASGIAADYEDPTKSYTKMKDFKVADCTVAKNVTDERDGKSYTVAPFTNGSTTYCYMLSNLRLDGGTVLNSSTSNVSTSYTVPANTDSTANGWVNDYCKPYMAVKNKEYYYNWPAATARTNDTVGSLSCTNDTNNTVGDICPAGWQLPTGRTAALLWNSGANPGMIATYGDFFSGSQHDVGSLGYWWFSNRSNSYSAGRLGFNGSSAEDYGYFKYLGFSVRCMRSS